MRRFVIYPDAALQLARDQVPIQDSHVLLAPTLLRSQLLARLYWSVGQGELTEREAHHQLDRIRAMRIRLLGDRMLQRAAWRVAREFGWADTYDAEYVALTQLQADAFVTADPGLARAARGLVRVEPVEVLIQRDPG